MTDLFVTQNSPNVVQLDTTTDDKGVSDLECDVPLDISCFT